MPISTLGHGHVGCLNGLSRSDLVPWHIPAMYMTPCPRLATSHLTKADLAIDPQISYDLGRHALFI
jgi:hypothetical protein